MTALAPAPAESIAIPEPTAIPEPPAAPAISAAVMALSHVIRRDIIECVARGLTSPSEIADEKKRPLGVVSYHVRMLRDYGVLEIERSEPRRGALQHYYRFTHQAVTDFEAVRDLANSAIRAARRGPKGDDEQ
jgi:DNA-binding transcriptional ArsR family regulator